METEDESQKSDIIYNLLSKIQIREHVMQILQAEWVGVRDV